MKVRELIVELQRMPPEMEVVTWDHEADEHLPIVQVLHGDGTPQIELLTQVVETFPVTEGG